MRARPGRGLALTAALMAALLALGAASNRALGHGEPPRKPTESERAATLPPMAGSRGFADAVLNHLRSAVDAHALEHLDQVAMNLSISDQIRVGQIAGFDAADAEYYRGKYEAELVELMDHLPHYQRLDLRPGGVRADPDRAIDLDAQVGIVPLSVVCGEGPTRFVVHGLDLTGEPGVGASDVVIEREGTTHVLLMLEHVPAGPSVVTISLRPEGAEEPLAWHALRLEPRPRGQLALEVVDETGERTPVLMRLTSVRGRRLFEPPNAVDLRPLMNAVTGLPIYGPGRGYLAPLPGPLAGRYWVVPGPFEMALPEGEWEIHVWHGPEYRAVRRRVRVEPGEWTRVNVRLERLVDMAQRGWTSGDDHVHARLMSSEDGARILAFARAADVRITNVLEMGDERRTYYDQRGFGPEFRVEEGGYWLIPGQEDPRSALGHAIGLNLRERVRDVTRYYENDRIAAEIHRQGGLYGHTHVGPDACFVHREMALFTPLGIVDFNSVMQFTLGTERYFDFLNLGYRMTASAGTDTPYGGTPGAVRLYAYTGPDFAPDRWFEAVRGGHTFVTNGPMVELTVNGALPGETIEVDREHASLNIHVIARGERNRSAPAVVRVIRFGEVEYEVHPESPEVETLDFRFGLSSEFAGGWIAAHVVGHDGSEALTTPVYVVRKGYRFWDQERAGELIEKQLGILDEIEAEVAGAEKRLADAPNPHAYYDRRIVAEAGGIRERVERARSHYQELAETLRDERAKRGLPLPPGPGTAP